jgi:hypothetical protein
MQHEQLTGWQLLETHVRETKNRPESTESMFTPQYAEDVLISYAEELRVQGDSPVLIRVTSFDDRERIEEIGLHLFSDVRENPDETIQARLTGILFPTARAERYVLSTEFGAESMSFGSIIGGPILGQMPLRDRMGALRQFTTVMQFELPNHGELVGFADGRSIRYDRIPLKRSM